MTNIKQIAHAATAIKVIVKETYAGKATVRIPGGKRLTGVPLVSADIKGGDMAILDYAGGRPFIRPLSLPQESITPAQLEEGPESMDNSEISITNPGDIYCEVYYNGNNIVLPHPQTVPQTISFNNVIEDTASMFNPLQPDRLTAWASGVYLVTATLGFDPPGALDTWLTYDISVVSSGTIPGPKKTCRPIIGWVDMYGLDETLQEKPYRAHGVKAIHIVSGLVPLKYGEYIQLNVLQKGSARAAVLSCDGTFYPHLQIMMVGQVAGLL